MPFYKVEWREKATNPPFWRPSTENGISADNVYKAAEHIKAIKENRFLNLYYRITPIPEETLYLSYEHVPQPKEWSIISNPDKEI